MNTIVAVEETDDCTLRERKKRKTRLTIHEVALRHVAENGLAGATIEAICDEAQVSQRTFFNYFPSKSAAALGLSEITIGDHERAEFLAVAPSDLVPALCRLVASALDSPVDREAVRAVVAERPELLPAMLHWMNQFREEVLGLVEQVAPGRNARLAVALVLGAIVEVVRPTGDPVESPLVDRLLETVAATGALTRDLDPAGPLPER